MVTGCCACETVAHGAYVVPFLTSVPACRNQDMYFIKWASTGKTKWVKRLNLLFADENRSGFAFRCAFRGERVGSQPGASAGQAGR